jgi:hypothetical protein
MACRGFAAANGHGLGVENKQAPARGTQPPEEKATTMHLRVVAREAQPICAMHDLAAVAAFI